MRHLFMAALLALASCGTPAYAATKKPAAPAQPPAEGGQLVTCRSTPEMVEVAKRHDIHPVIVTGKAMAPFLQATLDVGSTGIDNVTFVAVLMVSDGAAVFYGNQLQVCGPIRMTHEAVMAYLRPL